MRGPSLTDDGSTVTIDLHGLTVEAAVSVFARTIRLASERGRSTIKAIHGSSSTISPHDQTIRNRVREYVNNDLESTIHARTLLDDYLIIGLPITHRTNSSRIKLTDVI
ncbi:MAG: Smr/MutS family protein [Bacteroidetes bacterium]|nr:Smr/MutS family protein [Bacteroidota bacterium]